MTLHSHDALIHRLSRIEGQVRALKMLLTNETEVDCAQTLFQVKAATNGLKRFAEALAGDYVDRCVAKKKPSAQLSRELEEIINTVFTLS